MMVFLAGGGSKQRHDMILYLAGGINANLKPLWVDYVKGTDEDIPGRADALQQLGAVRTHPERERASGALEAPPNEGVCILESFYYADEWTERVIPLLGSFMLDSGAFTFLASGKGKTDWADYIERYADFINRNRVELFFELDIDPIVGYPEVKRMRGELERLTGRQPIPVWHVSRGKDEFLRMCDEYPYVAIGGIVTREIKPSQYGAFPWFIKEAHRRKAKIHALGFTNLAGIQKYHFDSVDSTAWVSGNRFGALYRFDGRTMVKYDKKPGQRITDQKGAALNNFAEWVKFQRWARTNL